MGKDVILGATLVVVGALILITAISGKTGSILAVLLAPHALTIKKEVTGTYRTIAGE